MFLGALSEEMPRTSQLLGSTPIRSGQQSSAALAVPGELPALTRLTANLVV